MSDYMAEFSDFRSDTVTRPTEKMKKAMAEAGRRIRELKISRNTTKRPVE